MEQWTVVFRRVSERKKRLSYHVVNIFEDGGEAADDEGELVLGDVDQTFFVVLCADFGVSVLVSNFNGKLKGWTGQEGEYLFITLYSHVFNFTVFTTHYVQSMHEEATP